MAGFTPSASSRTRGKISGNEVARALEPQSHPLPATPLPATPLGGKNLVSAKVHTYINTLEAFVTSSRPSKEETNAWEGIKLALYTANSPSPSVLLTSPSSELNEVKQELKALTSIVQKLALSPSTSPTLTTPSNTRSYSEVLKRDLILPSRRTRELIVSLGPETEEEKKRTGEALVKALRNPVHSSSLDIIAARRLPSTDIAITFSSTSACQQWEATKPLEHAKIKTRGYNVIIPRFPRGLSSSSTDLIDSLKASNPKLAVRITKATFLKKGLITQHPRIPLVLSLKEPQEANLVCEKGLVYKGEIYDCELFCGDARVKRCLKCQKYASHIAKYCRSLERCGYCGGTHSSVSCLSKEDKAKAYCVPCAKKGHNAFSTSCSSWRQQLERSRTAYLSRPNRFLIPPSSPSPSSFPSSSLPSSYTDEFTIVQPRKRKLPRSQTRLSFHGTSSSLPTSTLPPTSTPTFPSTPTFNFFPSIQEVIPSSQSNQAS